MAIRIHHTQQKQADKLGIELTRNDDGVTASKGSKSASASSAGLAIAALLKILGTSTADVMRTLASKSPATPKKAAKRKARRQDDEDGDEDEEPDEEPDEEGDEGKSVVKRRYKTAYKPNKNTCGDAVTRQVRAEFMTKRDPDTKKPLLDWPKFVRFAKNNYCWTDSYAKINHGLARMSVVNRLRARIRNKAEIKWAV